ncbi:prolyl oligopeptidase family serine peptidase [Maridesulfovibrio sp.]|uniref:alpha/beta hydrolase family protein n=1 Tax=Maridesulfovibrio sp. TaxID=2795000 RepID=UPI003BA89C29
MYTRYSFYLIISFIATVFVIWPANSNCAEKSEYQNISQDLFDIMEVPDPPAGFVSPNGKYLLVLQHGSLTPVEVLAKPNLGLAGILINPTSNTRWNLTTTGSLEVYELGTNIVKKVTNLPEGRTVGYIQWSPDSKYIAMAVYMESQLELWIVDTQTFESRKLAEVALNDILTTPYLWHPDSRSLLCLTVPEHRANKPDVAKLRFGPHISDSEGKAKPARTYQNLLQNYYETLLFEYMAKASLISLALDGSSRGIAEPALFKSVQISPSGSYLLTETIHRPFSYLFPYDRFPCRVEVLNMNGETVRLIDDLPLAAGIPLGRWGVRKGARHSAWHVSEPDTVWWVEAKDEGDPRVDVEIRDELFALPAPFKGEPTSMAQLPSRFKKACWGATPFVYISSVDPDTGESLSWTVNTKAGGLKPKKIKEHWRNYLAPEFSLLTTSKSEPFGTYRTSKDGRKIYLFGSNAPQYKGRDVLLSLDIKSGRDFVIWEGAGDIEEQPIRPIDDKAETWLVQKESFNSPVNFALRNIKNKSVENVTNFGHPIPELEQIRKERLVYNRVDGVRLEGDLYLPPGYTKEDGPLPTLIWIYPREYTTRAKAEAAINQDDSFIRLGRKSRMYWPLMGYALLDNPTMPIIGSDGTYPNDTFVQQLVMDAQAAVEELVKQGVSAADKIAVGGHSYGAFATANLLAHSDLFAAGIARSGAYNRTLTPFGFQREHRNYWLKPDLYRKMSPFNHASKIKNPLLLIHGEQDQNAGTYPEQSIRFYQALAGLGKTARLVLLPHEGHSYYGRESISHMIWEMKRWLDMYLKSKSKGI